MPVTIDRRHGRDAGVMSAVHGTSKMMDQIKAADMEALRSSYRNGTAKERAEINATLCPVEVEFADIRMVVDPRDNYTETCIWLDGYPPELKSLLALVQFS